MKQGISIIIPAYNEESSVALTIKQIKDVMKKNKWEHEIIVVDDGSTDKTAQKIRKEKVKLLQHPYNIGYGAALKTGIRNSKYEIILIMDADGSYSPRNIPKLVKNVKNFDMIIGIRTQSNKEVTHLRKPLRWITNKFASYLAGKKISDVNSGMRIFRKSFIQEIMKKLPDKFSFTTTSTLLGINKGLRILEVPISQERRSGKSKLSIIKDGIKFPSMMIKIAAKTNPSKVFLPSGVFLIIIGIVYGIATLLKTGGIGDITTLSVLSGVQVILFGILAEILKN